MKSKVSIFWFRRDLRLADNAGLAHALAAGIPVLPIFIFDPLILDRLEDKQDRRVDYIQQALDSMHQELQLRGASLRSYYGNPLEVFAQLTKEFTLEAVYCNRDYEPAALARDREVYDFLLEQEIPLKAYKDQVIFDRTNILKSDGKPYTVYTPYARKWKSTLEARHYALFSMDFGALLPQKPQVLHSLADIGFKPTGIVFEQPRLQHDLIADYDKYRDFPALEQTSLLGMALRFGTISIRQCVAFALAHNQTWLSELIWREFFMQILYHFPTVVDMSFKPKYDHIAWRNDVDDFERWCIGTTGYPMVDAGMRQLNQTGFMHNRVRMVVASFLCKHLLIDWRWGEAYFASKLDDYDLSANNGNWQWAAGSGCDAAPYFRVFNPTLQAQRFDKDQAYIRKWVPEFQTDSYSEPIVDHAFARDRVLKVYGNAVR